MSISRYLTPVAAGLAFHALPTVLNTVFPKALDDFPCSSMRKAMREFYERNYVNTDAQERVHHVIIPDNIGLAGAFITAYFEKHGMSLWEMDLRFSILFVAGVLHAIAGLKLIRQYSYTFGIPLAKKLPFIGTPLSDFFMMISPSDLRPYDSLFEKFIEIIQNSAFVKALVKAAAEVEKAWVGIPVYQ